MRTGPTNPELQGLIEELRKKAYSENTMLWKRLATDLEKPTRKRRAVNLSRINRHTSNGETIVVPGKVLSAGDLEKQITIAAYQFSKEAMEKITKSKSRAITINELMNTKDVKNVRIIG